MRISPINGFSLIPKINLQKSNESSNINYFSPLKRDTVSFSGKFSIKKVTVPKDNINAVTKSFYTSTAGHRAE